MDSKELSKSKRKLETSEREQRRSEKRKQKHRQVEEEIEITENEEKTGSKAKVVKIADFTHLSTDRPQSNRSHGNTRHLSAEEWSIIEEGIESFALSRNLNLKACATWMFPSFFNSHKRRTGIWKHLESLLPGLNRGQIQGACTSRYLMPRLKTGPWTPEENEKLFFLVEEYGEKWSLIGRELNRFPNRIRSHYMATMKTSSGEWSLKEEEDLIEAIKFIPKKVEKKEQSTNLLDGINWEAIAELVSTRSAQQCMQKWYHSPSFHEGVKLPKEWSKRDDQHLLRALFCSKAKNEEFVNWSVLVPGRTEEQIKNRWDEIKSKERIRTNLQKNVRKALQRELPSLYEKLKSCN